MSDFNPIDLHAETINHSNLNKLHQMDVHAKPSPNNELHQMDEHAKLSPN